MVGIKLAVLVLFIAVGVTAFESGNLTPFFAEGFGGATDAAALIFFAYIGFDAISTSGEETREPERDLPIAILGSLAIATVLYIAVSLVAVGAMPYTQLAGDTAPLATVLEKGAGVSWGATVVSVGALVAITSVVLTILYGQTRIMFAMSRDGLVPPALSKLWERTGTPALTTALFGVFIALIAAFLPLSEIAKLVNIGTLFAFFIVNVGVIVLRRTRPDLERGFRVPFVPVFPIIGALLCIYLMTKQDGTTWLRFIVWMAIGVAIYALYGRKHSKLRHGGHPDATEPEPA